MSPKTQPIMKRLLWLIPTMFIALFSFSQSKLPWAKNFGIEAGTDFAFGMAGMSSTKASKNPLINSDIKNKYSFTAAFYAEFLKLKKRDEQKWGSVAPNFGIKTRVEWQFFRAD